MNEFTETSEFLEWFNNWDMPLSLDNPLGRVPRKKRLFFLSEVARQSWNYQQNKIDVLTPLITWMEANVPEMDCRGDEDCDHCLAVNLLKGLGKNE